MFARALGIVGVGGVLASAASLNIANSTLGAGTTVIASCDTNGVSLVYTNTYVPSAGRYNTSAVTVNGLNNVCDTKRLDITLKQNTGAVLAFASSATSRDDTRFGSRTSGSPAVVVGVATTGVSASVAAHQPAAPTASTRMPAAIRHGQRLGVGVTAGSRPTADPDSDTDSGKGTVCAGPPAAGTTASPF